MLRPFLKNIKKHLEIELIIKIYTAKYNKIIKKIKNKNKIKVVFLSCENSKWTYQKLYELFDKSPHFEPVVLVGILESVHLGLDRTRNNIEENYNFFKSRGIKVDYAYKNGKYIDLNEFKPDIVFYEQPWDLPKIYMPKHVSNFALTYYQPYAFEGIFNTGIAYHENFHRFLYKFIGMNHSHVELINSISYKASYNCFIAGYSKLDTYFERNSINIKSLWKEPEKFKIIYAPHHSFEEDGLQLATFGKNAKFILELAKKYKNTSWIFKPHPRFKYAVVKNNIMSEEEIESYYKEWESIGKIHTEGNYFDIFKTSDLMITDCASFLAEYLPAGKPLIRLVNSNATAFTDFAKMITKGYYETFGNIETENTLINLIANKDYKKEPRLNLIKHVIGNKTVSEKIFNDIIKDLNLKI